MDIDLLAQCWLCSWPFREGRTTSTDAETRRVLAELLADGFQGVTRAAGPRVAEEMVRRAAFQDPSLAPKTAQRRPLIVDEQTEWARLRRERSTYGLWDYYAPEELPAAHWR